MSRAKKVKTGVVHIETGPVPVWLFLAHDPESFYEKLEEFEVPPIPFVTPGACASTHIIPKSEAGVGMNTLIMCFDMEKAAGNGLNAFAALAAHEAVHAAEEAWKFMGEEAPGDEVRAYTVQYIVQKVLDEIRGSNQ